MNRASVNWLLAGALAASLGWNWRLTRPHQDPAACVQTCTPLDTEALALSPEQERALDELCAQSCSSATRLEERAAARERELLQSLASGALEDERAHEIAGEISALRADALRSCVDGILAVRQVLTAAQLEQLVTQCAPGDSCAQPSGAE